MPSAVIKAYAYDPESETLEISYHSGKVYHYLNVPKTLFKEMRSTMAKGIWFNRHIKGKYRYKEVTSGLNQAKLFPREIPVYLLTNPNQKLPPQDFTFCLKRNFFATASSKLEP